MTTPEERGWLDPLDEYDAMEQEAELEELGGFHELLDEIEGEPLDLTIWDELDTMDEELFYDLARKLEEEENG